MKKFFLSVLCAVQVCLSAADVTLVWQANRWEEDWVMEVLSGLDVELVEDTKFEKFIDHSIVVVSSHHGEQGCADYFTKLHEMNYKFGVILLSDEWYNAGPGFWKHAEFVFRTFWHKKYANDPKIVAFPLGYKKGFWSGADKRHEPAARRPYNWSFAGQITWKPTRESMIHQMKQVPSYHIHETFTWEDPNALSVKDYRTTLLNSIFVPCPTGWWNLDSYRVYEALECGCIPIVEKQPFDYFAKFLGDNPFITIDSWDQAPLIMNVLLADPVRLEQRRKECVQWWANYKKAMNEQFKKKIQEAFHS